MITCEGKEVSLEETLKNIIEKKENEIKILTKSITNYNKELNLIKEENKIYMESSIKSFQEKINLYNQREEFYIYEIKLSQEKVKKIEEEKELRINMMKKELEDFQNSKILRTKS